MKKKILVVLGLLMGWYVQGQVVMNLQLPPLGLMIKPQLWDLSFVNSTNAPVTVQLQMVMKDVVTNQTVLTGISPQFVLPAGLKAVTQNDVAPISYAAGPGLNVDPSPIGFLPVGVYNVCYTLTKWTNDISEQLGEDCATVEVEPASPPLLMHPGDSDIVYTTRPFFTWLPPSPINGFSLLQYDWLLVEVQPMQTASDAIQQNIPLLTQPNLAFTSLQYPLSMPELDTNKLYAWRVTAKNNSSVTANSEIWSFRIRTNYVDPATGKRLGLYSPLQRDKDGSYVICDGVLHYRYTHELNTKAVAVSISDLNAAAQKKLALDSATCGVQYGPNYLDLDLTQQAGLIDRHMYLLEVINDRQERWYLKFEYRKPEEE